MVIKVKRAYDKPTEDDGVRILVDRLWPRGIRKEKAEVDLWLKDIAPSNELRKWFSHDPTKWDEFKRRYFKELDNKSDLVALILNEAQESVVTLLFGAKTEQFNNAVALKSYVEERLEH
ncbi:MAG: DUF488 domain-containing protein [Methanophagales archaeon]|nr:DUF488 domain-containing protein [Methanophagales archaeon]